jgi:hypothetical protein
MAGTSPYDSEDVVQYDWNALLWRGPQPRGRTSGYLTAAMNVPTSVMLFLSTIGSSVSSAIPKTIQAKGRR